MKQILLAGSLEELTEWLERRLGDVSVRAVSTSEEVLQELAGGTYSLLVLDQALAPPPAPDLLATIRAERGPANLPVIYCAQLEPGGAPPAEWITRAGVAQVLFHPLDREELARHAADLLGISLPSVSSPSQATTSPKQDLQGALSQIWEKFKDKIFARVDILEQAATDLLEGTLSDDRRRQAEREAHKLAGSVGTFGFIRGSRLAREMEQMLEAGKPLGSNEALQLSEMVVALRAELDQVPVEEEPRSVP